MSLKRNKDYSKMIFDYLHSVENQSLFVAEPCVSLLINVDELWYIPIAWHVYDLDNTDILPIHYSMHDRERPILVQVFGLDYIDYNEDNFVIIN